MRYVEDVVAMLCLLWLIAVLLWASPVLNDMIIAAKEGVR